MKTNHLPDFLIPQTQVINVNLVRSLMVNSNIGNSSSESFQNESEFGSIWE